jgi:transposase
MLPVQLLLLLFVKVARRSSTLVQNLRRDNMSKKRTAAELEGKRQAALAALKAHKYNVQLAAQALGYTTRYVQTQLDKYKERGSVSALPRSGRPKLLSTAQIEAAAAAVLQHQSVAKAAAVLKQQGTIASTICDETVARAVKKVLELAPVQQQPILTSATKKKRLAFSRQQHDSNTMIAIDSTILTLSSTPRRRKRWVRKGDKPVASKPVKGQQLHVYGGITKYGVTRLIRVTGSTGHPKKYHYYCKKVKAVVQHSGVGAAEFQEVLGTQL